MALSTQPYKGARDFYPKDKRLQNWAFIDAQNINLGIRQLGWNLDWVRFRVYLREKYGIEQALLFIGFIAENKGLYASLQKAGFVLIFKETFADRNGQVKGNVDAELIMEVMTSLNKFYKALIVSSDGDFGVLVKHLVITKKLLGVLSPNRRYCSSILRRAAGKKIQFMDDLKQKIAYIKKRTP